ncbi:MAG: Nramp family divalent metal transporter, partial [Sphingobacteriaceae bacterium]|nr:Nramp family divalent metal transporter [Sphingobacteriaceae bacterium]
DIAKGFKPTNLSGSALYIAIGIIGATVMPHNLYLHSSLVQTRKFNRDKKSMLEALKFNFIDTIIALNFAFFVNASILILAATAFYKNGYYEIAEIQDAYQLLKNIFGNLAPTLFAIGLIAAGQSSTITGTLAGQIIMEGHLNLQIKPWLRRFITRLMAIIPAFFTLLWYGENALGALLILSQVILSLQLGFAIIPLIHITSNKLEMKEFVSKKWVQILAWLSATIIISLNIKLVFEELSEWIKNGEWYVLTLLIPLVMFTALLLIYILVYPIIKKNKVQD